VRRDDSSSFARSSWSSSYVHLADFTYARNPRGLRNDGGSNLIAEGPHWRPRRPNKLNWRIGLGKGIRESWVFGGMPPSGPDGMDAMESGQLNDQGDIGVVVIVTSPGHIDDDVAHSNVFGVGTIV
jgi:hypothetical protein